MNIPNSEKRLCISCMQEHIVDVVEEEEQETFHGLKVTFNALYEYCPNTDEYLETEEMIRSNGLAVKDAYRKAVGLLTSQKIKLIREKYGVSQKEFSEILGWGMATITRYENHQIQNRAHDDILRKIDKDPSWFIEMLERAKDKISRKMYIKYYNNAYEQYIKKNKRYSYKAICANIDINVANSMVEKVCFEKFDGYLSKESNFRFTYPELPTSIKEKLLFAM